jgi:hypothetical protein
VPARRTATVVAALALAAVPATASAASGSGAARPGIQTFFSYTVTFKGSGTYGRKVTSTDGLMATSDASFRWTSVYKNVFVPQVKNRSLLGYPAVAKGSSAGGDWKITSTQPGDDASCTGVGTLGRRGVPGGGGGILTDGGITLKRTSGGIQVLARAVDGFATPSGAGDGSTACNPKDYWHDEIISGGGVGQEDDTNEPLTGITKITPKDLKRSSFTKTVLLPAVEAPATDCGGGDGTTCTQTYAWTGKVTFVKKRLAKAGRR